MLKLIFVVAACLQAVSAFTCPEDSGTFYHADVSTGCQVYHLCEHSHVQTLTCPSGQAFNYATSQCEDSSTVKCIETMGDHSHHHHHHKRSIEEEEDFLELNPEILDQMIKKKPPNDLPKEDIKTPGILAAAVLGTIVTFETTLIYCKHFGTCSSSLLSHLSQSQMEFLNRERSLFIFERYNPHMNFYVLKRKFDDDVEFNMMLRYIFSQYFNINQDAFLAYMFDDKPYIENDSHQEHRCTVEQKLDLRDLKHIKSAVDKTVQEKHCKNFQIEERRKDSVYFLSVLSHTILTYCKHYESCSSSIHANGSRSDGEVINGERIVATFKRNIPKTDIFNLKEYFDDSKPLKDIIREGFSEVFNISDDVFLSYFFDDKPYLFITRNAAKLKPLLALLN